MENAIGTIKENNNGTLMRIIAYRNSEDIDVEFLDDHHYIKKNVTVANFQKGTVKNPYDKTVFGIGYIGDGDNKTVANGNNTAVYNCWKAMIARCYSDKYKDLHQSYYTISDVSFEWKNFQNFATWYNENKYEVEGRLHLDKDILYPGNKTYSPYHCLLVPQRINMLFTNKPNSNGLPNGITKINNGYKATYNTIKLGTFDTLEDAYESYAKEKERCIKEIAEEYKNIIPQNVYEALLNYEVRIENDKNYTGKSRV